MDCEYCGNTFKDRVSLKIHQTRTKYCIKIQEDRGVVIPKKKLFKCEFCGAEMATDNKKRHLASCKVKKQMEFESKSKEVDDTNEILRVKEKEMKDMLGYIYELHERMHELEYFNEVYRDVLIKNNLGWEVFNKDGECDKIIVRVQTTPDVSPPSTPCVRVTRPKGEPDYNSMTNDEIRATFDDLLDKDRDDKDRKTKEKEKVDERIMNMSRGEIFKDFMGMSKEWL